mgnify:FL=1
MTCETCRYCIRLDDGKDHCKRYPPVFLGQVTYFADGRQQIQSIVDYLPLNRSEACGEWRAKDEPV